ncbi:hypothetical protein EDEG_02745 [Edhazardia aedis USNM 41457]|uniref:Uncharacterized protein n=1 Tax=Edhazardia aedis (strain USNM 41457) TaxID=1003232 RepID=J9DJR4_EDHAE|nr:hypothetical protein EDEG_02745 [Edhazardia aedis USNM 41457]|eukprot:EJW02865.1 hypothetical protein EDEG_02745 [Edhazardia aedis USNM 41457]
MCSERIAISSNNSVGQSIFLQEKFIFIEDVSYFKEVVTPDIILKYKYKTFLDDYESNAELQEIFIKDVLAIINLIKIDKLDASKYIGKMFFENERIHINDDKYEILRDSIVDVCDIKFSNSSIYTDKEKLAVFIQNSILNCIKSMHMNYGIPKIFFKCCKDVLIAEILCNSAENYYKHFKCSKNCTSYFEKNMKKNIDRFLIEKIAIDNKLLSMHSISEGFKDRLYDKIKEINEIFFSEKLPIKEEKSTKQNVKDKIERQKSKFLPLLKKNDSLFRKVYHIFKKKFKKLKKNGYIWDEKDETQLIKNYINSILGNRKPIIIYFELFDLPSYDLNVYNSLFYLRLIELKNTFCTTVKK